MPLTGNSLFRVVLFFIPTVLLHSIFGDGLHLNSRGVGQHAEVLKQPLPAGDRSCRSHTAPWGSQVREIPKSPTRALLHSHQESSRTGN